MAAFERGKRGIFVRSHFVTTFINYSNSLAAMIIARRNSSEFRVFRVNI
jgi:hypothetical protein